MSKGLEALKRLKWGYAITHEERINLCECIEKELKRLEWYDNLEKPTSGILPKKQDYRLNQLLNSFEYIDQEDVRSLCQKRYEEIIDIIDENEANKKALEIIKKAFDSSSIYTNKLKDSLECGWITQEEYDLLKEVLL